MVYLHIFLTIVLAICGYVFQKNGFKIVQPTSTNRDLDRFDLFFCFLTAIMLSMYFFLNPFYKLSNHYVDNDPAVFIYIGQRISEGFIPYLDLFDHKGIILYLIQFLGVVLFPYRFIGIWLLELLNILVCVYYSIKTLKFVTKDRYLQYMCVLVAYVIIGGIFYNGGNYTEEFAMSGIAYALYLFSKGHLEGRLSFTDSIGLGVSFAYVFFLRCNMVGIWAILGLRYIYIKFQDQEYNDLKLFVVGGLIGVLLIVTPIMLYCLYTNSLQSMIESYFFFNLEYKDALIFDRTTIIKLILAYTELYLFYILSFYLCSKHNTLFKLHFLAFITNLIFCSISGRPYWHYGMILVPTLVIVLAGGFEIIKFVLSKSISPNKCIIFYRSIIIIVLFFIVGRIYQNNKILMLDDITAYKGEKTYLSCYLEYRIINTDAIITYLKNNTKKEDDVLILANNCMYYLLADRKTRNKYPYQVPPMYISNRIYDDFSNEFLNKKSDYVVNIKKYEYDYRYFDEFMKPYIENNMYRKNSFADFDVYIKN